MKTLAFFLILSSFTLLLPAQSPFAPFKDGIYQSHKALQKNTPSISFDSILQTTRNLEVQVGSALYHPHRIKKLELKQGSNRPVKINIEKIWALCYNGVLYISCGKELIRVIKFGSICHFALEEIRFGLTDIAAGQLSSRLPTNGPTVEEKKHRARQFVLDFQTGEILSFKPESLSTIFKRDPVLYDYFRKEADKKIILFRYLLEYNRRHPLFRS